ncbi:PRC-barrel domain-containing protein [Pseudoroseicyclus aestuarii]|uniref:PRC-barrel domain protein n=1 Tax=Pseudoroseicyclus aestuarii TaxID=1795041 RepID=A0A318SR96_9RHOB|nr:PRC-barrel domain-containing protein [Pseudoroseicyclus aestuarii]PYE80618.1 PRC-barrel domain protein [Pseudoroseicyclus aestuarii]
MKSLMIAALALPLAGAAAAQTADPSTYTQIENQNVLGADGTEVGEIEAVLVDGSGSPAAVVVEIDDGFLDLGDTEVIITLDALNWDGKDYTTSMTEADVENLPVWDD